VNLSNNYDKLTLYKNYEEIIPDSYNDGILLLDKDKKVLFINNTGASILKIDRKSSIGKQVIDIVDFTPVVLNVFKTGKDILIRSSLLKVGLMVCFILSRLRLF